MSLVVLTAAVMNADGRVTQRELDYVRRFFVRQFGEARAKELLLVLRDVLKREIPVGQVCEQIRQYAPHPLRLQLVHYLSASRRPMARCTPPSARWSAALPPISG